MEGLEGGQVWEKRCLSDSESPSQFTGEVGPGVRAVPKRQKNGQQGRETKQQAHS